MFYAMVISEFWYKFSILMQNLSIYQEKLFSSISTFFTRTHNVFYNESFFSIFYINSFQLGLIVGILLESNLFNNDGSKEPL
jgi:hypothetical protein